MNIHFLEQTDDHFSSFFIYIATHNIKILQLIFFSNIEFIEKLKNLNYKNKVRICKELRKIMYYKHIKKK